ncbi:TPA: hypothetical protein PW958_001366, partial [Mannheimia haemolytica]|nr:hypothetical protein [Mannheimia haemolytica]
FILINCLGGILFSIPYKLYVQQTAKNISYEFSIRYTIHNIASALSPLLFYLFLDINSYLLFMLVISILFTLFSLKVNAKIAIRKERFFISFKSFDKDFFVFVFLSYILFSMCYLLYEQLIPTILKQWGNFNLYPIWVILNSIAIALLQIRLYKSVTKRITHQFSLILSFIICIILSGLFMFISQNIVTLFIVLVGVTYLEMFFSTAMDTLIASSKYSKDYFIFANFFLAIGATLSALSYSIGIEILGYVLLFLLCMLCIIYRKIFI